MLVNDTIALIHSYQGLEILVKLPHCCYNLLELPIRVLFICVSDLQPSATMRASRCACFPKQPECLRIQCFEQYEVKFTSLHNSVAMAGGIPRLCPAQGPSVTDLYLQHQHC